MERSDLVTAHHEVMTVTEVTDAPAPIWFSLGLIRLMLGQSEAASDAYEVGIARAEDADLVSCLEGLDATMPELENRAAAIEIRERLAHELANRGSSE